MRYLFAENDRLSGTKTAFTAGVAVVLLKVLLTGVTVNALGYDVRLGADDFDYGGAAMLIGALGAILYGKKRDETQRAGMKPP